MKENELQKALIEAIQKGELLEIIGGSDQLEKILAVDSDKEFCAPFSIDDLLRRRYATCALRVLDGLGDYELISETIKNISLDAAERLYPDLILFNSYKNQFFIIENKTSSKTEREAMTELLGYSAELRNHLPFLSIYDLNFILVSTHFNELLDHSVAAQVLSSETKILCLKPAMDSSGNISLHVHVPSSWTPIGQYGLPENALVSDTLHLYEKEDLKIEDFDAVGILKVAVDLIMNKANSLQSHGFYIAWRNCFREEGYCKAAISLYVLNPFAFLPHAHNTGLPLNKKSALSEFILGYIEERGTMVHPHSISEIAKSAETFLETYFDTEWDRSSEWVRDAEDKHYAFQRYPVVWDSWGAIGEYVRYFYLHPANQSAFAEWTSNNSGYLNPFIGLQIIDLIVGYRTFKSGDFSPKEIFRFGLEIGFYHEAVRKAVNYSGDNSMLFDANLFWNALPLARSLKDISYRVWDSTEYLLEEVQFPIAIKTANIYPDYESKMKKFIENFETNFINNKTNPTIVQLFDIAISYYWYFWHFNDFDAPDYIYQQGVTQAEMSELENLLSSFVKTKIAFISKHAVADSLENSKMVIELLNKHYFNGKLSEISPEDISTVLDNRPSSFYARGLKDEFLDLLDLVFPRLFHELRAVKIPSSVDWHSMYQHACRFFENGKRKGAIIIKVDGEIFLGEAHDYSTNLTNKEEILVCFPTGNTVQVSILKILWAEIFDGSFVAKYNSNIGK